MALLLVRGDYQFPENITILRSALQPRRRREDQIENQLSQIWNASFIESPNACMKKEVFSHSMVILIFYANVEGSANTLEIENEQVFSDSKCNL